MDELYSLIEGERSGYWIARPKNHPGSAWLMHGGGVVRACTDIEHARACIDFHRRADAFRSQYVGAVREVLAGFFGAVTAPKIVREALLAVLPEGSTVRFVTGGDASEPEGAVVTFPGGSEMVLDDPRIVAALDWSAATAQPYHRLRNYPATAIL